MSKSMESIRSCCMRKTRNI